MSGTHIARRLPGGGEAKWSYEGATNVHKLENLAEAMGRATHWLFIAN